MLLAHFDSGAVYDDGDGYLHIFCSGRVSIVLFGFAGHSRLRYVVIVIFVYPVSPYSIEEGVYKEIIDWCRYE